MHSPGLAKIGFYSSFSLPLTVSAWSSTFKKKSSMDPSGIQLRDMTDTQLLVDLRAADDMYKTGEMKKNNDIYERLCIHRVSSHFGLL